MSLEIRADQERVFGSLFSADNLFSDLTPRANQAIARIKQKKHFQKGESFSASGKSARCFYILQKGQAQLLPNENQTVNQPIRLIEQDEIIGLTETIADIPFEVKVKTITPCVFEIIEREDFIRFLYDEPEVCFRLLRTLSLNYQKFYRLFCSAQFEKDCIK